MYLSFEINVSFRRLKLVVLESGENSFALCFSKAYRQVLLNTARFTPNTHSAKICKHIGNAHL